MQEVSAKMMDRFADCLAVQMGMRRSALRRFGRLRRTTAEPSAGAAVAAAGVAVAAALPADVPAPPPMSPACDCRAGVRPP